MGFGDWLDDTVGDVVDAATDAGGAVVDTIVATGEGALDFLVELPGNAADGIDWTVHQGADGLTWAAGVAADGARWTYRQGEDGTEWLTETVEGAAPVIWRRLESGGWELFTPSGLLTAAVSTVVTWVTEHPEEAAAIGVGVLVGVVVTALTGGVAAPLVVAVLAGAAGGAATTMTSALLEGDWPTLRALLVSALLGGLLGGATFGLARVFAPFLRGAVSAGAGEGVAASDAATVANGALSVGDDAGRAVDDVAAVTVATDDVAAATDGLAGTTDDAARAGGAQGPTVVRGGLTNDEYAQAQRFTEWSGEGMKGAPDSAPGIDGWLDDGTPLSLKSTSSPNPVNVLRELDRANASALKAGYTGGDVVLVVDARNMTTQELLDFAATDPYLAAKLAKGTFRSVYVETSDGWVILKADGVVQVGRASVGFTGALR